MAWDDETKQAILNTAQRYGYDPVDFGTVMSYETGGTMDPWQKGPTTQWGQHRGFIQMGEPQRQQFGYSKDNSVADNIEASARYLQANGYKPGMPLIDMYSTINAGRPGRYTASDANNGGAPGNVADKVATMGNHRNRISAFLGDYLGDQQRVLASRGTPNDPGNNADLPAASAQAVSAQAPAPGGMPGRPAAPGGFGAPRPGMPPAPGGFSPMGRPGSVPGSTSFGAPGGGMIPQVKDDSYKTDFSKGGPGALFGMGREGWDPGDALMGVSAALLAMSGNHQGAAAMAGMLGKARGSAQQKPQQTPWQITGGINQETGKAVFFNRETGQVEERQVATPYRTMDEGARKAFDSRNDNINTYADIIGKSQKYQKMIANGEIDLSRAAQIKDFVNSQLDNSDTVGRNTQAYLQDQLRLANAGLRLNKGVQTDADFKRTYGENNPDWAKYDNRGTIAALQQLHDSAYRGLNDNIKAQNAVYDEYGAQAPRGTYRQDYAAYVPQFDAAEKELAPIRDKFMNRQDPASLAAASGASPRVQPGGTTDGQGGTLSARARQILELSRQNQNQ